MAFLPYPRSLSFSSLLHLFIFRAERLGREKVLKVVGLNPTGITRGCSCLNCTSFIRRVWHPAIPTQPADDWCSVLRRVWHPCHTHAALVSAVSAAHFYIPTQPWYIHFCYSHRPTQTSASTDADVRIDRRRCSYRPTQMSVSTDADVRIDRRRW